MPNSFQPIWKNVTQSTNYDAGKLLESSSSPVIVAALFQSGGRGQGDHSWHSAPGENLTFSIALRLDSDEKRLRCSDAAIISRFVPVTMKTFLLEKFGIEAGIKYPNDILVGGRKISGILIENSFKGEFVETVTIGIGLNVNERDFPADIPSPSSVAIEKNSTETIDIRAVLNDYLILFFDMLELIFSPEGRGRIDSLYKAALRSSDIARAGF